MLVCKKKNSSPFSYLTDHLRRLGVVRRGHRLCRIATLSAANRYEIETQPKCRKINKTQTKCDHPPLHYQKSNQN